MGGEEVTVAEVLKTVGYQTAVFGKWHLNGADWENPAAWTGFTGSFPRQQGFDHGFVSKENPHMSRRLAHNSQKYPGDYFDLDGKPLGTIKKYSSKIITDATLDWLKRRDCNRPFFLYLPYDAVHETIVNPDRYDRMYDTGNPLKDQYYAKVTSLDHQIGRLIRGVDRMGLQKDTIIYFTSDNGPGIRSAADFTDRYYGTSYPLQGQKRQVLEGGIRVPGMVRWTGHITPGISAAPNSMIDLLPTLAALAGAELPRGRVLDGTDISSHLLSGAAIFRPKPLYWQVEIHANWDVEGEGYNRRYNGQKRADASAVPAVAMRSGHYVVRGIHTGVDFKLPETYVMYDVVNDPVEKHELSKDMPELFARLVAQLKSLHHEVNAERMALEKRRAEQAAFDTGRS